MNDKKNRRFVECIHHWYVHFLIMRSRRRHKGRWYSTGRIVAHTAYKTILSQLSIKDSIMIHKTDCQWHHSYQCNLMKYEYRWKQKKTNKGGRIVARGAIISRTWRWVTLWSNKTLAKLEYSRIVAHEAIRREMKWVSHHNPWTELDKHQWNCERSFAAESTARRIIRRIVITSCIAVTA